MLFNSIDFLLFFPIVTLLFFLIPAKIRSLFLLGCSLYFYMCWNAKYIVLIGFSILVTYCGSLLMEKFDTLQRFSLKKATLAATLLSNLAVLFVFKYYNFFADTLLSATAGKIALPLLTVALPVGISFYTFQALGYSIDVYRKEIAAEKNLFTYALFISFYPQLVAGPIERSANLLKQLKQPTSFQYENMRKGLLLMGWGMFQKLVIADRLALFVDGVYSRSQQTSGSFLALGTVLFAFQIYCDFASYSNIAKGAAKVMGYELMLNFNAPYRSKTFAEFWSRWHISLSTWFQDYLFEPIVWVSKNKELGSLLAVFVVFLVSGFWHGAAWTFVVWGLLHAVFRILGILLKRPKRKLYKAMGIDTKASWFRFGQTLFVFVGVCITYIFFRADSLPQAFEILQSIVLRFDVSALFSGQLFEYGLDAKDWIVGIAALAVLFVSDSIVYRKVDIYSKITQKPRLVRWAIYWILIFSTVIFGVYGPSYNTAPFIYFQF